MTMQEIQAMAFAENEMKAQHVYVSLYDNLTMIRRTTELLKSLGRPSSAHAVAAHLTDLRKSKAYGSQYRMFASIENHLCEEAKLLLKEDAQLHLTSNDCVFSRNNLYCTTPPLYNRHPRVQVAVMKRMIAAVEGMQKTAKPPKDSDRATRIQVEHKQINQWVGICESVHQQIELSDSHLNKIAQLSGIREWGPRVQQIVAEVYQAAWAGAYDAQMQAVAQAKDKKQLCQAFEALHELIMSQHEPEYGLTYEEEQEWKEKCSEAKQQNASMPPMPLRSELTEAQKQHKAKKMKEAEEAAKRAAAPSSAEAKKRSRTKKEGSRGKGCRAEEEEEAKANK